MCSPTPSVPVQSLRDKRRAEVPRQRPEPHPHQRERDEREAMREALSDEVDVESLLLTDDGLSFRRPGIGADVPARLRRGQWALQGELDLHGLTREEARERLARLLARSRIGAASAACAWCTARATDRRAGSRCSRTRCSAGSRNAAK